MTEQSTEPKTEPKTELTSPLLEANPLSIQELFDRDPEELTDGQIEALVVELRKQRTNWNAAEIVKANKVKGAAVALDKAAIDDLLKDL